MRRESFWELWRARREKLRSDYEAILSVDPYDAWEKNKMPESVAEESLAYALEILYSGDWGEQAQTFLRRTREVCERLLSEQQLTKGPRAISFPKNRARVFRAQAYAEFLSGATLEKGQLLNASRDFETWCKAYSRADWSGSQAQAAHLAAVRLMLMSGNSQGALDLLENGKPMAWHQTEFDVLTRLASEAVRRPLLSNKPLLDQFDTYFDQIRSPNFKSESYVEVEVLRLEMGAIRYEYFCSPDGQHDPHRTIEGIVG